MCIPLGVESVNCKASQAVIFLWILFLRPCARGGIEYGMFYVRTAPISCNHFRDWWFLPVIILKNSRLLLHFALVKSRKDFCVFLNLRNVPKRSRDHGHILDIFSRLFSVPAIMDVRICGTHSRCSVFFIAFPLSSGMSTTGIRLYMTTMGLCFSVTSVYNFANIMSHRLAHFSSKLTVLCYFVLPKEYTCCPFLHG